MEDTALCFNALGQLPGVYMYCTNSSFAGFKLIASHRKWFMAAIGHTGLNDMLAAYSDKSAQSVCTFTYCEGPGKEPIIFQGRTDVSKAKILQPP